MVLQKPRLVIAALRGGAGKTFVSLGLAAAWRLIHGFRVIPFKKGPDYIDAGWLSVAAGEPCYNLDPFLMEPDAMLRSFVLRSSSGDGSLIEGNRGLYDGVDARGSYSTAELAKFLRAPVILVLDVTKVTRTAAALVLGCQSLDPAVDIAGVILNHVAGKRHERVLREAIEGCCDVPVLGVIPKEDGAGLFPERHLGLVPHQETDGVEEAVEYAASRMKECVDLDALWRIAKNAGPLGWPISPVGAVGNCEEATPVVIGVLRDSAFQFYYPENLEALEEQGAIIREISSFSGGALPPVDALYIGGGFPETHLDVLAANHAFRDSLKGRILDGLPVYAECGGLMFLCRSIGSDRGTFPMTGIFPFDVVMEKKPQGHGYTVLECVGDNPYFERGQSLKGHEFHYSRLIGHDAGFPFVFRLAKGHGIVDGWDGLSFRNVLASYSHIHAVGNEHWADAMIRAARCYRLGKQGESLDRGIDPEKGEMGTSECSHVF